MGSEKLRLSATGPAPAGLARLGVETGRGNQERVTQGPEWSGPGGTALSGWSGQALPAGGTWARLVPETGKAEGVPLLRGPGRPELRRDSCPGSVGKGCRGSGCRAGGGPDVIPPAEGGNLGSETKRHLTPARPQIPAAMPGGPPPIGSLRPLPSSRGPGAGGWGPQQQASCPPGPAPCRNALGVKLMRKQRLPSQRPGNPAMEQPTVPPTPPLLSGTAATAHPSLGFPCVRRDEGMSWGCVVSCPSSPNPAWTHPVRLPRRVGERGVRGPQPQVGPCTTPRPPGPEQEALPPGAGAGHSL